MFNSNLKEENEELKKENKILKGKVYELEKENVTNSVTYEMEIKKLENKIEYLKKENEKIFTYDDARCFDIETSVHICLKKDWDRIHKVSMIKGGNDLETHQVEPVLYSMDYIEEMKEWYE